jgi:hypothetical protein
VALSGSLQDVPVTDLLQFIHVGVRSGTLKLESSSRRAEIAFHRGRIVSACSGTGQRLGELLVTAGVIDQRTLSDALGAQRAEHPRRALPSALVDVVGAPLTRQCVTFPILGSREVIAVIYADNGARDQAIDELDVLELATAQVGVVFENEVLRRRLLRRDEA